MKKEAGNVLPLEAGNSLFTELTVSDETARAKAALIVEAIAGMGVRVMGVGMRDLSAGPEFVQKLAAKHGIKPLSANLAKDGKLIFAPSAILTAGGLKVGVIGASPPNPFGFPGVAGLPLAQTVIPEAKKLRKQVDVVIVLAAVMYADAMQLATLAGTDVDFVLQTHDGRGVGPGIPIAVKDNFLIHTGERGRQIARLDLKLDGPGRFADATAGERDRYSLQAFDARIAELRKRIASTNEPKAKESLELTLVSWESRRADQAKALGQAADAKRTIRLTFPNLGRDVASDPKLAEQVARFGPSPAH